MATYNYTIAYSQWFNSVNVNGIYSLVNNTDYLQGVAIEVSVNPIMVLYILPKYPVTINTLSVNGTNTTVYTINGNISLTNSSDENIFAMPFKLSISYDTSTGNYTLATETSSKNGYTLEGNSITSPSLSFSGATFPINVIQTSTQVLSDVCA